MRIVITQNMTLDGRVEMIDNWFDPTSQDEELAAEIMAQSKQEQVLLLGRKTFCEFRGFWPNQTEDTTGVSEHLNRVDKRVVSATLTDPEWENSTIISGEPLDAVRELRSQPGGDVVVTGSIMLAHALIGADLVDEYRLFVCPAWQGRGRSFFPDGFSTTTLKQTAAKTFASGVTYLAYEPES